jgi:hypothetical protein
MNIVLQQRQSLLMMLAVLVIALPSLLHAQGKIPPIVSDTTWTYQRGDSKDAPPPEGPSISVSEASERLFFATAISTISVLNTVSGSVTDTINLDPLFGIGILTPKRVYCNANGSQVLVMFLRRDTAHWGLISYPEKQLIREFPFDVGGTPWEHFHLAISPSGRYVIGPWEREQERNYGIYDLERDTVYQLAADGYEVVLNSTFDFDDDETALVFWEAKIGGGGSRVVVVHLNNAPFTRTNIEGRYSSPVLSGDGKRIAVSSTTGGSVAYYPGVTVLDVATKEVVWTMRGSQKSNLDEFLDLNFYRLSYDGSKIFVNRHDTAMPAEFHTGLFYRIPETTPFARTLPRTFGPYANERGMMILSSDLTQGFVAPKFTGGHERPLYIKTLYAGRFDLDAPNDVSAAHVQQTRLVYPNPTSGTVHVPWDGRSEMVLWTLVDATGRTVETGTAIGSTETITLQLGSALPAGAYGLRLADESLRTHSISTVILR